MPRTNKQHNRAAKSSREHQLNTHIVSAIGDKVAAPAKRGRTPKVRGNKVREEREVRQDPPDKLIRSGITKAPFTSIPTVPPQVFKDIIRFEMDSEDLIPFQKTCLFYNILISREKMERTKSKSSDRAYMTRVKMRTLAHLYLETTGYQGDALNRSNVAFFIDEKRDRIEEILGFKVLNTKVLLEPAVQRGRQPDQIRVIRGDVCYFFDAHEYREHGITGADPLYTRRPGSKPGAGGPRNSHKVKSSLNGNNGTFTGTDDHEGDHPPTGKSGESSHPSANPKPGKSSAKAKSKAAKQSKKVSKLPPVNSAPAEKPVKAKQVKKTKCPSCGSHAWNYTGNKAFCYTCQRVWELTPEELARFEFAIRESEKSVGSEKVRQKAAYDAALERARAITEALHAENLATAWDMDAFLPACDQKLVEAGVCVGVCAPAPALAVPPPVNGGNMFADLEDEVPPAGAERGGVPEVVPAPEDVEEDAPIRRDPDWTARIVRQQAGFAIRAAPPGVAHLEVLRNAPPPILGRAPGVAEREVRAPQKPCSLTFAHLKRVLDSEVGTPKVETHKYVVCERGGYLEFSDTIYECGSHGWFPVAGGAKLQKDVRVHRGNSLVVKGTFLKGGGAKLGGEDEVKILSAFRMVKLTVKAMPFEWFKSIRIGLMDAADVLETVFTLGNGHACERTLYTNMTKRKATVVVYRKASHLLGSKICSVIHKVNNAVIMRKLLVECPGVPVDILIDCAVLFVEERALATKRLNATTDAANKFLEDKHAWVAPARDDGIDIGNDDKLVTSNPEGIVNLTSHEEALEAKANGQVCVVRRNYSKSDRYYEHYLDAIRPNYNYEPCDDVEKDRADARGVTLDETGLHFSTYITCEETWQTKGTHFATQSAVVNHKDTMEYVKATQRVIAPRDGEVAKREQSTAIGREILKYMEVELSDLGLDCAKEKADLVGHIKVADPKYEGDLKNSRIFKEDYGVDLKLTDDDRNFCYIRAMMQMNYAVAPKDKEGERLLDHIDDLTTYIDTIGSKVRMRKDFVRDHVDGCGHAKSYLAVSMKPHEAQKYKQGRLKYGRTVVSVVGEGWVLANPPLFYDNKHMLEHIMTVEPDGVGFKIDYLGTVRRYEYPYPDARVLERKFSARSVLSDTALTELGQAVSNMEEEVEVDSTTYSFVNHGDDMLSCYSESGKTIWVEGDIAGNDGCHVDSTFYQLYLMDRLRGEDVVDAYAQLAYPVRFQNPMEETEFMYARYEHGMRLVSGSVLTTFANCNKSQENGLAHAFYGGSFMEAAGRIGVDVTSVIGKLTDVSFLSKIFYYGEDGNIVAALDHASLMRKFGCVAGDVGGSSKTVISERMVAHSISVIKGHVGEPDSLLMRALRARYSDSGGRLGSVKRALKALTPYVVDDLNVDDYGALLHYYGAEEILRGQEEYITLANMVRTMQLYGSVVYSNYVDQTMQVRYGMAPAVTSE